MLCCQTEKQHKYSESIEQDLVLKQKKVLLIRLTDYLCLKSEQLKLPVTKLPRRLRFSTLRSVGIPTINLITILVNYQAPINSFFPAKYSVILLEAAGLMSEGK